MATLLISGMFGGFLSLNNVFFLWLQEVSQNCAVFMSIASRS